ncbi:DUF4064 domain-containing protein [Bacillus sp. CECT 9360]|uniref:DUF4064 domain-containing protein n=1 Tax=Bacillus sp. CECT 9360 TaxID=2845821 RepID=UPI001E477130|nr:DUF4064 domain-containing protein [Bacillus sp. CECT 9360]CAH0345286.1 hypothetical protein BCI9360_01568 [Bacillus sp. CECT 9360]
MKRTGEYVLGIIGVILSALMTGLGAIFIFFQGSEDFQRGMENEFANDPTLNSGDVEMIMDGMDILGPIGWLLIVAAILGFVFGLIAVFLLKRKPKAAGIVFIVGAVLVGLVSVGAGFLPGLLYLIAGIMCLVRKPKTDDPVVL